MMPVPWFELTGNVLTVIGVQTVWVAMDTKPPLPISVSGINYNNPTGWTDMYFDNVMVMSVDVVDWHPWDVVIHSLPWGGNCARWFTPEEAGLDPSISWSVVPDVLISGNYNNVQIVFPNCGYYVVYAFYCPQHNTRRVETSGFDFGCVSDSNHDCSVTIDDLLLYLQWFQDGSISADIANGNVENEQPDGGVDINDLLWFLQNFVEGC